MTVLRHWLAYPADQGPGAPVARVLASEELVAAALATGDRVDGPFVPEPPQGAVDVLRAFPEQTSSDTDGYAAWLPAVRDWNERRRALLRGSE